MNNNKKTIINKQKHKSHEKFIIAKNARKSIQYIENTVINFPKEYFTLKNKTIECSYNILENIYRANIFQDIKDKKEIIVQIQLLNFYLDVALRKGLITEKKYLSFGRYLLELDSMVRTWISNEEDK